MAVVAAGAGGTSVAAPVDGPVGGANGTVNGVSSGNSSSVESGLVAAQVAGASALSTPSTSSSSLSDTPIYAGIVGAIGKNKVTAAELIRNNGNKITEQVACDMIMLCVENVPAVELAEKAIAYGVHAVTTGEAAGAQTLRESLESGAMATRQLLALAASVTSGGMGTGMSMTFGEHEEAPRVTALPKKSVGTVSTNTKSTSSKSSVRVPDIEDMAHTRGSCDHVSDDALVCRCERVTAGRIRA